MDTVEVQAPTRTNLNISDRQGLTIKLKKDVPLAELTEIIASANDWVRVVLE